MDRPHDAFRRAAAATALLSVVCLAANGATWITAADGDIALATEPSRFVGLVDRIDLLRASLAFDVGAYVLLVPLIAYMWTRFGETYPERSRMYAAGGLAYSLVGATGAVVLAAAWPPLMRAYAAGAGAERETVRAVFEAITEVVYRGMWNVIGAAGLGVWLLGYGTLLRRVRPGLARLGVAAGCVGLLDAVFVLAGWRTGAKAALLTMGVLATLWIVILAWGLLRDAGFVTEAGRRSDRPGQVLREQKERAAP